MIIIMLTTAKYAVELGKVTTTQREVTNELIRMFNNGEQKEVAGIIYSVIQ